MYPNTWIRFRYSTCEYNHFIQSINLVEVQGKSGSDIERILAFHSIGRQDPIAYQDTWENVLEHALMVESQFKGVEHLES